MGYALLSFRPTSPRMAAKGCGLMQHHLLADFRDLKYSLSTIMSENVTYMCIYIYVIICMHIAIL